MIKRLLPTLFSLALAVGIIFYGQHAADFVLAKTFEPTSEVSAIDKRLKLTQEGSRLFFASKATVQDAASFNTSCQSTERTAAILGCYYKRHIYLFDISNPELDGATEVTAAHEMLHAAYDRLNFFERDKINDLIKKEYETLKDDPAIAKDMEYYKEAEPGAELNELHSIIGTTAASISPELEEYYSRYFENRASVVSMNDAYNAVFSDISARADTLQNEITALESQLKIELAQYEADRRQLEIDIQTFNDRAASRGFTSQSSFTTARLALSARVAAMNDRRAAINASVDAYNAKIVELKALSVKVNEFNKSMNGVTAPSGV